MMYFIVLSLLLNLEICVSGQLVQFVSPYEKGNVAGQSGHSVTFTWKFSGGRVDGISWGLKKDSVYQIDKEKGLLVSLGTNGGNQVPSGSVPEPYKGRVNGNRTGDSSGQASFTLSNITKDDERFYGCELDPSNVNQGPITDYVKLVLVGPPDIKNISENQTADEGDKVTLTCTAVGNPPSNISWIRIANKAPVTFPLNIGRHDEGGYRCIADNGFGIETRDVFITVQYPAAIRSATPEISKSWIGQTVILKCVVVGSPTPTVAWKTPNGTEFNAVTSLENEASFPMNSNQEFGIYTCEATNGVGDADTRTVQVQQIKAPGSPSITLKIGATSVTVSWLKPTDVGGSPITAYRVLVLQDNTEIKKKKNITQPSLEEIVIGGLNNSTNYTVRVFARNYVFEGYPAEKKIRTKFEGVPAAAEIIDLQAETKEINISLKWKEAGDNGAPITGYTVYQRTVRKNGKSQQWKKIREIEEPSNRKAFISLEKGKEYEFVVTATNKFGEGGKEEGKIKKVKVLGDVPGAVKTTCIEKKGKVILTWNQPASNGADITRYKVYQKRANKEQWAEIETVISNASHEYVVSEVEKGGEYDFVVTATNDYGDSPKMGGCKGVKLPEDSSPTTKAQTGSINTVVVAGAAAAGVLLIMGVVVFGIWWKRRKNSRDDPSSSAAALRSDNHYEPDDGYQDVSASAAARGLQAEAGPMAEPDYAQVDVSKKKRNRRPVTDEYAQVEKSKNSKKPRKQPGELDYAELDDFRPSVQPVAAAAEAAPARPLIRRPAYEGTEYADITQFGVPQPEPTYGNVPKKDVVYSNVQGI